jgi:pyruvate/2-oxoglutarate dehydrogenase complex dihydrolipoamide dehydrogenase (E3) component
MAGINAMAVAHDNGARVALVERDRPGGTCPLRGCIPSKALIRCAEVAHEISRAAEFGIRVGDWSVDFPAVMARVRGIIDRGANGTKGYLDSLERLDLIQGEAELDGPDAVRVDGRRLTAPTIIVATGAGFTPPQIPGLDSTPYLTSDDVILRITELPSRLVVVGGGPIGLELGQALSRLGAQVTIVEILERILPAVDVEVSGELVRMLREEGIEIIEGAEIERVEPGPDGGARVVLSNGVLEGDGLLIAAGRGPNTRTLRLEEAGVEAGDGGITVDSHLRTTQPSVWAAGDVLGAPYGQITHIARRQGVQVAQNALSLAAHDVSSDPGPRTIFTDPELVTIGMSEEQAREAGHEVRVGTGTFSGGKARAWGEEHGLARVITDARTKRILGAQILAYHSADLVHPIATAMAAGDGTGEPILRSYQVHPTLGEVVRSAVERAHG